MQIDWRDELELRAMRYERETPYVPDEPEAARQATGDGVELIAQMDGMFMISPSDMSSLMMARSKAQDLEAALANARKEMHGWQIWAVASSVAIIGLISIIAWLSHEMMRGAM